MMGVPIREVLLYGCRVLATIQDRKCSDDSSDRRKDTFCRGNNCGNGGNGKR
ncbi:hypothetical protein WN55_01094 [Dufourea novaeangliae]|uniref:Uncharacterized protein n=1 Tax=Dufourea novaeangliae TaxID=178035 RepID=A0A154PE46_DUFNO|nr:hypothetical protein WN55_01094 [Dufourea novaeangliae]